MEKKLRIKKSVLVSFSLFVVLLISVFITMLLFKITDYGITIASFGATIFMALSKDKLKKKKIFGSYIVATFFGYMFSRFTEVATLNVALAAVSSVVLMTLFEFQHAPAIGISVALVLNKFSLLTDLIVLTCILILIALVITLRILIKSPEKVSKYIIIEEQKIKWNLQPRTSPKYLKVRQ